MKYFFITSKNLYKNKEHAHGVFIDTDTGEIVMSAGDDGHTHQIVFSEGLPLVLEAGGHVHLLKPIPKGRPIPKDSDDIYQSDGLKMYETASNADRDYLSMGEECYKFYFNDQWPPHIKAERIKEKKSVEVFNHIQPNIDRLVGIYNSNRRSITTTPIQGDDVLLSSAYDTLLLDIQEKSMFFSQERHAVYDLLITGRGNLTIDIEYDHTDEPQIRIKRFNWRDVLYGPYESLDGSDCLYCIKQRWMPMEEALATYGTTKNKRMLIEKGVTQWEKSTSHREYPEINRVIFESFYKKKDSARHVRVWNCQRKRWIRTWKLKKAGYTENLAGVKSEVVDILKNIPGVEALESPQMFVEVLFFVGSSFLDSWVSELGGFDTVLSSGMRDGYRVTGKVEPVLSSQREINLRQNQAIDYTTKAGVHCILSEEGTFIDDEEERRFEDSATRADGHYKVKQGMLDKIRRWDNTLIPAEIIKSLELAFMQLQGIMNVDVNLIINDSVLGDPLKAMAAFDRSMLGNEHFFEAVSMARLRLGARLIEAINMYYTADRVMRILSSRMRSGEWAINGVVATQEDLSRVHEIWSNNQHLSYDIQITESMYAPTNRIQIAMMLYNLILQTKSTQYMPFLLKYLNIAGLDRFLEEQNAIEKGELNKDQMEAEAEMRKTQIAAESRLKTAEMNNQAKILSTLLKERLKGGLQ